MGLQDVIGEPPGVACKTACTDGRRIYWNPDFLAKLDTEEARFVCLHETMHPAHGHLWRFPEQTERTNAACDYAINGVLAKLPGVKMPKGGLLDARWDGMAEEEIFSKLPENPSGKGQQPGEDVCGGFTAPAPDGGGQDKGQDGKSPKTGQGQSPSNAPAGNQPDKTAGGNGQSLEDDWKERVIQAAQAAKALGQGSLPADLQRVLDRTLSQKIDWKKETADFIRDAIASRNDWSRSARRFATAPVIYPRRRHDDVGLLVCVRDTSGSISDEVCAQFSALIEACQGETNARALIIDCDAQIQGEQWVNPGEEIDLRPKGGGGTCFAEIPLRVAKLQDEGERIAGVINLTDLYGSDYDTGDVPTLWLCTSEQIAKTGRTVQIEL